MSENHEELPDTVTGLNAESDVVAARSGATTPTSGRPVPADPPEARDSRDAGTPPQGAPDEQAPEEQAAGDSAAGDSAAGEDAVEEEDGGEEEDGVPGQEEVRPDIGPTG